MMQQIEKLKRRLQNEEVMPDEVTLEELLESAKFIILNHRYPLQDFPTDEDGNYVIENRYLDLQLRIAIELYAKEGAEGETNHTENGVSRNYASAGVSPALLNEIVPKGKVL